MPLNDKTAIVTGGASGIGRDAVRLLREAGARPIVLDIDTGAGEQLAQELDVSFVELDVRDPGAWAAVADRILRDHGGADIAFLNAGIGGPTGLLRELTAADIARTVEVNLLGVIYGVHQCVRLMHDHGGSIVVTASIAGLRPSPYDAVYTATKHGVVGLVRALAPQLAEQSVTINAVCPTLTDTPLVRKNAALAEVLATETVPMLRAKQVADAVLAILEGGRTGEAVVCSPGRPPYAFAFPDPIEGVV